MVPQSAAHSQLPGNQLTGNNQSLPGASWQPSQLFHPLHIMNAYFWFELTKSEDMQMLLLQLRGWRAALLVALYLVSTARQRARKL